MQEEISICTEKEAKTISKPWGSETWLASGEGNPYLFKLIRLNRGFRTSLQYHEKKIETVYLLSGKMRFHHQKAADGVVEKVELGPGACIHIPVRRVHRMEAIEDCVYLESSGNHPDDVVRLSDDYNRLANASASGKKA